MGEEGEGGEGGGRGGGNGKGRAPARGGGPGVNLTCFLLHRLWCLPLLQTVAAPDALQAAECTAAPYHGLLLLVLRFLIAAHTVVLYCGAYCGSFLRRVLRFLIAAHTAAPDCGAYCGS
jgi:hypothetical protein